MSIETRLGRLLPRYAGAMKRCRRGIAVISLCVALVPAAAAQAWPAKPVKIIAVFPPGGSVDQVARIVAQQLTAQTGQPVIVENRGGASGSIGTAALAKADPDGTTLINRFATSPPPRRRSPEAFPMERSVRAVLGTSRWRSSAINWASSSTISRTAAVDR